MSQSNRSVESESKFLLFQTDSSTSPVSAIQRGNAVGRIPHVPYPDQADAQLVCETTSDSTFADSPPKWAEPYLENDAHGRWIEGTLDQIGCDFRKQFSGHEFGETFAGSLESNLDGTYPDIQRMWMPSATISRLERSRKLAGILSSRLGKELDNQPEWFAALHAFAVQASVANATLISGEGTTSNQFLRRISRLLELPLITVVPMPTRSETDAAKPGLKIYVSCNSQQGPRMDDWLAALCCELVVLKVRANGNVEKSLGRRLNRAKTSPGFSTRILVSNGVPTKVQRRLIDCGAKPWLLHASTRNDTGGSKSNDRFVSDVSVLSLSEVKEVPFLIHWTRRRNGAWPGQANAEYLDDLILGRKDSARSAASTLGRILKTEKLIGSAALIRHSKPVVCFADMTLDEFRQKRVFRSHLARWDFEHYGIAFDREWLQLQGARPVRYGDDSTWLSMAESERPFFQHQGNGQDWSQEKEWRWLGDFCLKDVPANAAIIFVASENDIPPISKISKWPIVVLGESGDKD